MGSNDKHYWRVSCSRILRRNELDGGCEMKILIICLTVWGLAGCGASRTVRIPIPALNGQQQVSSYLSGCLLSFSDAKTVNLKYLRQLEKATGKKHAKYVEMTATKVEINAWTPQEKERACTQALVLIGQLNTRYRLELAALK